MRTSPIVRFFVVSQAFDDDGGSLRAVAFIDDFLIDNIAEFSGAFFDGPVNIFTRHVGGTRFNQSHSQTGIRVRILAALFNADHDFFGKLGKNFTFFLIGCLFFVFDVRPFALT